MTRDYSQAGEQEAILAWAKEVGRGSFVDLGCYDGETYSNTAALADMGWPGVCIDAAPDAVAACAIRYADRPDIEVIVAALDLNLYENLALMYWAPQAMYTGLSASKRADTKPIPIYVPVLEMDWFDDRLFRLPQPLFCSIDLEGNSIEVLKWVIETNLAECICVEANNPPDREVVQSLEGWETVFQNNSNIIIRK